VTVPRYPIVCIDLDHTLLDSDTSEAISFDTTLRAAGVPDPAAHLEAFLGINGEMWGAVERGEMAAQDVRLARFRRFVVEEDIAADPAFLADTYAAGLAANGELLPGALEALDRLAGAVRLALVTNGVSDIQRTRMDRLGIGEYFETVVISSEVGVSKPGAGFFDVTFERLGSPARDRVLMVGDSLTSDMRGGIDYGLATCWFNPAGASTDLPVTYEIDDLAELPAVVLGA
jgi:YjjG family noncanonical pyrimidine nucleotidase